VKLMDGMATIFVCHRGYQSARKLPVTSIVDENTGFSKRRHHSSAGAYTITAEDLAGDFEKIPSDLMQQAKLNSLGYQSPEEKWASTSISIRNYWPS